MSRWLMVLALLVSVMLPCTQASASYAHNEIVNGDFDLGGQGWEYNENMQFGEMFGQPTTAYDPPGINGGSGYLRQIVDDSLSPGWDPTLNQKVGLLSFWLYTTGPSYVQVGFDWWDRLEGPKPIGYNATDYHYVVLPEQYRSEGKWSLITVPFDWAGQAGNNQPRWVSIEIYFFGCTPEFEAAVDSIEFTAKCVPEPSSLFALAGCLLSAGFTLRRRR